MVPRTLQIFCRRKIAAMKLSRHSQIWPIDPDANKKPFGWDGWPERKQFAFVVTHDVETAAGCDKVMEVMELDRSYGFRSAFYFVAEGYAVAPEVRNALVRNGCEVGVHGLRHSPFLYSSRESFNAQAVHIKHYLARWSASGFRSPLMLHNLDWIHALGVKYDASTFDTDPFEPQADGMHTIFPFWVRPRKGDGGYVEIPYTLCQDFTLFVILEETSIDIWKRKLNWIAENGGMAHIITHPDFMKLYGTNRGRWQYPVAYYRDFLEYVAGKYGGMYWNALPKDIASFWTYHYAGGMPKAPIHDRTLGPHLGGGLQ